MRFLSNAHTHTRYCDGKSTPQELLAEAQRLGFVSLGFSGHGDQGFDLPYSMALGMQEQYLRELRALQAAQREEGGLRLWVGLEQDGLTPLERKRENRKQFDYILGSTHYVAQEFQDRALAVDGDFGLLGEYVRQVFAGDWMALAKAYFDAHVQMLLTDRPHIIGHFDLVRKAAELGRVFDENTQAYRRIALEALEKARASDGVMEVNTGGMARGYAAQAFPSWELLGAWREMGGQVTITSDCHDAAFLGFGLDEALDQMQKLGYRSVQRLGRGESLFETVAV